MALFRFTYNQKIAVAVNVAAFTKQPELIQNSETEVSLPTARIEIRASEPLWSIGFDQKAS